MIYVMMAMHDICDDGNYAVGAPEGFTGGQGRGSTRRPQTCGARAGV